MKNIFQRDLMIDDSMGESFIIETSNRSKSKSEKGKQWKKENLLKEHRENVKRHLDFIHNSRSVNVVDPNRFIDTKRFFKEEEFKEEKLTEKQKQVEKNTNIITTVDEYKPNSKRIIPRIVPYDPKLHKI